jgi:hypothetical protein
MPRANAPWRAAWQQGATDTMDRAGHRKDAACRVRSTIDAAQARRGKPRLYGLVLASYAVTLSAFVELACVWPAELVPNQFKMSS